MCNETESNIQMQLPIERIERNRDKPVKLGQLFFKNLKLMLGICLDRDLYLDLGPGALLWPSMVNWQAQGMWGDSVMPCIFI